MTTTDTLIIPHVAIGSNQKTPHNMDELAEFYKAYLLFIAKLLREANACLPIVVINPFFLYVLKPHPDVLSLLKEHISAGKLRFALPFPLAGSTLNDASKFAVKMIYMTSQNICEEVLGAPTKTLYCPQPPLTTLLDDLFLLVPFNQVYIKTDANVCANFITNVSSQSKESTSFANDEANTKSTSVAHSCVSPSPVLTPATNCIILREVDPLTTSVEDFLNSLQTTKTSHKCQVSTCSHGKPHQCNTDEKCCSACRQERSVVNDTCSEGCTTQCKTNRKHGDVLDKEKELCTDGDTFKKSLPLLQKMAEDFDGTLRSLITTNASVYVRNFFRNLYKSENDFKASLTNIEWVILAHKIQHSGLRIRLVSADIISRMNAKLLDSELSQLARSIDVERELDAMLLESSVNNKETRISECASALIYCFSLGGAAHDGFIDPAYAAGVVQNEETFFSQNIEALKQDKPSTDNHANKQDDLAAFIAQFVTFEKLPLRFTFSIEPFDVFEDSGENNLPTGKNIDLEKIRKRDRKSMSARPKHPSHITNHTNAVL